MTLPSPTGSSPLADGHGTLPKGGALPLVSICIPTYNGAEFLDECLDCARAQTYPHLEILLVDDGSSDDTLPIARRHAAEDPRITVHANPRNLGLVGNWNHCIELASGEWIKFLFQDDLLHPGCVELQLAEGVAQSRPLVACDRDFLFDNSVECELQGFYRRNRETINQFLAPRRGASAPEYAMHIARELLANCVGEPTVTLIHRRAFADFGLFSPALAQKCDSEYWNRVAGAAGIAYVPETLATFRVHAGATSSVNRASRMFRAVALDSLIFASRMLDEPVYAELRRHWCEAGVLGNVERKRHDLANEARMLARLNGAQPLGKHTIAAEYEAFLAQYPQCRVGTLAHLTWRLRSSAYRLKQRITQQNQT